MEFSINDVFVTYYVMYNDEKNKMVRLPRYCLPFKIVKRVSDEYYADFIATGFLYKDYKSFSNVNELKKGIFFGELLPIHPYLNDEELESGIIIRERLMDIYYGLNGVRHQDGTRRVLK